ncbi:Rieske (2Fe-2S) protein [Chloroflexota bacterium]
MMAFTQVAKTSEIPVNSTREFTVVGHEILVAHVGDAYYAANNRCPHVGAKLAGGKLEGTVITCSLHGSKFDLRNGKVIRWTDYPAPLRILSKLFKLSKPLKTYEVKVEGEQILANIPE